jgi:hypothetical protein
MRKIFIVLFMAALCGCNNNNNNKSNKTHSLDEKHSKLSNGKLTTIDLNKLTSQSIENVKLKEHRTLTKIGQISSIEIAPNIISKLIASTENKAKNDYGANIILSTFKIYLSDSVFFQQDHVLAISPFDYNSKSETISFLIIKDQNTDTFSTTSDLYLISIKDKRLLKIKTDLTNSANAPFSKDGKSLYYLDNDALFGYNIQNNKTTKIADFVNNDYTILNIEKSSAANFKILYLKDITSGELFTTDISISHE